MQNYNPLILSLSMLSTAVNATDYTVDFSRIDNLEAIRPLVESCKDFDSMELYRDKMQSSENLEQLRTELTAIGLGMFNDCKEGISSPGITAIKKHKSSALPDYSVNFKQIEDFETLRPLIEHCKDFDALEVFRGRLEKAKNLNDMRQTLLDLGYGTFDQCAGEQVSGPGITHTP